MNEPVVSENSSRHFRGDRSRRRLQRKLCPPGGDLGASIGHLRLTRV